MAQIDFAAGFDAYYAAHQKVWRHDRSKSVGASEAFGCMRKSWFSKNNADKDPDASESWGALKRGDLIEEFWVEPAMRWYLETHFPNTRLTMGGKRQRTLIDESVGLSATPDGLVINADDDALAAYGIESLGGTGCFNFEIKSVDPRVNLREEKAIHRGQTIVQMGLTRQLTRYKPNYAVILYADASFLDDINVFIIPFDQRTYDAAKVRAQRIFTEKDVAKILPEGKIDGTCEYCPYKIACAIASREATPDDGEASGDNTNDEVMEALAELIETEREAGRLKKKVEKDHSEAKERLKHMMRDVGKKRVILGDTKASLTWVKGKVSYDTKAMLADGLDLSPYTRTSEGYDTLRVTEKGVKIDET